MNAVVLTRGYSDIKKYEYYWKERSIYVKILKNKNTYILIFREGNITRKQKSIFKVKVIYLD